MAESCDTTMTPGLFLTHSANSEDTEVLCGNLCISAASRREKSAWCTVLRRSSLGPKQQIESIHQLTKYYIYIVLGEADVNLENQWKGLTGS